MRRLRRRMLEALLEEFGGPKALATIAGTVDTHLIAMQKGRRNIGDELATKLEAATNKPFGWMDGGLSEEALEIALQLDSIADAEQRQIAMALAYSAAHRRQQKPSTSATSPTGAPVPDR